MEGVGEEVQGFPSGGAEGFVPMGMPPPAVDPAMIDLPPADQAAAGAGVGSMPEVAGLGDQGFDPSMLGGAPPAMPVSEPVGFDQATAAPTEPFAAAPTPVDAELPPPIPAPMPEPEALAEVPAALNKREEWNKEWQIQLLEKVDQEEEFKRTFREEAERWLDKYHDDRTDMRLAKMEANRKAEKETLERTEQILEEASSENPYKRVFELIETGSSGATGETARMHSLLVSLKARGMSMS